MRLPQLVVAELSIVVLSIYASYTVALATPTVNAKEKLQVKYFNLRGAAELSRVLLAIGEESYNDIRYTFDPQTFKSEDFDSAKEAGDLITNLNRAPVLVTDDGLTIGQSRAMERFLAKRFGLMGSTAGEEALIDCVTEHCRDVKDAAMRKGFSAFSRDKTEEEKLKARNEWFNVEMPTFLGKIDQMVEETSGVEKGYAVGNSRSYADVSIWYLLRECSPADLDDTTKASEKCETLNAIADAVSTDPRVIKWLTERPATAF
mmetsp:Transcript_35504/g.42804  ORF Transcript_35504/g.42804 Transcript_35504/m.42804 type:complete len:261 (-) Transcript_35504:73-855(-)|eukprot:CAMPEP_0171301662 /NCGR_PEP_ID=MMETSP0816-20121228/10858_1 /TAXON_ID=420281 /ORGANISM="Proboscia inermis, Strain CCAP1064/1" /LENGTH=260 /DNA_ID=CAMNT_0011779417 /DNA_START=8 /DNA_END=790 /DNA_ORIENTATION=+